MVVHGGDMCVRVHGAWCIWWHVHMVAWVYGILEHWCQQWYISGASSGPLVVPAVVPAVVPLDVSRGTHWMSAEVPIGCQPRHR